MDLLWSASTTVRNPERTFDFLETAAEIEGEIWNHATQRKYQTLLIKNRYYKPDARNLPDELSSLITNYEHEITFEEASEIFERKQYVDSSMRGRTSLNPLTKLGLVSFDESEPNIKRVQITEFGRMFLTGEIDLGEVVFTSLLKTQFPNPLEAGRRDYNIKPFIGTLQLIRQVNELCRARGLNPVGISREEFGIFVLSLKSYTEIATTAERLVDFRERKRELSSDVEKKEFVDEYISSHLGNFQNPHKNIKEYTDNIIRYLRLTRYIFIRGGGYYIDLEPRRMVEIDAILAQDNGSVIEFTKEEYMRYISDYRAYILPFETVESLTEIANNIIVENRTLAESLGLQIDAVELPETSDELNQIIDELRVRRAELQNLQVRNEYQDMQRIDEAITALSNTLSRNTQGANRPSVELEKWANIALNILNDAVLIRPNAPLGDDNEPTFTAPRGVPDIECYYEDFGAICEVTMLTGRNQWYNEGQPVMRHLRSFEQANNVQQNYCLFVAPRLHADTLNTFWISVRYEYEGQSQKIIPITITKLIDILGAVRNAKAAQRPFRKEDIQRLYDNCVDIADINDSTMWAEHIGRTIDAWGAALV